MAGTLQIQTIVSLPFEENTYVIWQEGGAGALVIDPGLEPDLIVQFLRERRLAVIAILNTHGHADHIGGIDALKRQWPNCPIVIGRNEAPKLISAQLNLSADYGMPVTSLPAES